MAGLSSTLKRINAFLDRSDSKQRSKARPFSKAMDEEDEEDEDAKAMDDEDGDEDAKAEGDDEEEPKEKSKKAKTEGDDEDEEPEAKSKSLINRVAALETENDQLKAEGATMARAIAQLIEENKTLKASHQSSTQAVTAALTAAGIKLDQVDTTRQSKDTSEENAACTAYKAALATSGGNKEVAFKTAMTAHPKEYSEWVAGGFQGLN